MQRCAKELHLESCKAYHTAFINLVTNVMFTQMGMIPTVVLRTYVCLLESFESALEMCLIGGGAGISFSTA